MSFLKSVAFAVAISSCYLGQQLRADSVENFSYPDGPLVGLTGGSGWSGGWNADFTRGGGDWLVDSGAAFSPDDGSRYNRAFASPYNSGLVYLDFTMQVSGTSDDPFAVIELLGMADINTRLFSIGTLRGDDGANTTDPAETEFYFRSETGTSFTLVDRDPIAPFNTSVNRFITRFDLDADTATVFFNPTSTTDLVNGAGVNTIDLNPGTSFGALGLANFGSQSANQNSVRIDNVFMGSTAPTVMDIPVPAVAGDVNNDGSVSILDFNLIRDNFRTATTFENFMTGDISGPSGTRDQYVDFYDFIAWSTAFENAGGSLAGLNLSLTSVPEPATGLIGVIILGTCGLVIRRRR